MQSNTSVSPELAAHLPVMEAITALFHPHVEAVLHNLEDGTIAALYNNLSKRAAGDRSAISKFVGDSLEAFPDVFPPYTKTNWDGKQFKSVSVTIRNKAGKPVGLMCFNFDTSVFTRFSADLAALLAPAQAGQNPIEQFTGDWQARVNECIGNYLKENNTTLNTLTKSQKQAAVHRLYAHGLFNYRRAAGYISAQLGVSRATVYNYLKEQ